MATHPLTETPIAPTCPDCGMGFMEFRRQGRLGCAHDYEAFRVHLVPLMNRLHRSARHVGKSPRHGWPRVADFSAVRQLRRQLAAAVAADNFELAATVRDQLREKDRLYGP